MSVTQAQLPDEATRMLDLAAAAAADFVEYDRARVARIVAAAARVVEAEAAPLARRAVDETGFGVVADKASKNQGIAKTFLDDYANSDFCAQRVDAEKRMMLIPRPAGVVFGVTPSTSPVAAVAFKVLCALLTRNAIIISPHPGSKQVSIDTAKLLANAAEQAGAPRGAVQVVEEPSIPLVEAMMADSRVKLVIATGGGGVVRSAYRSGTPALGVGPGNAPVVVDETTDLKQVSDKLIQSKTYDNGVLCTTESVLIAVDSISSRLLKLLAAKGAYVCSPEETHRIRDYAYPGGKFNTQVVGRDATTIAAAASVVVPANTKILLTPIDSVTPDEPLTHEKLSPILAYRQVADFAQATADAASILSATGAGHSAAIHSEDPQRVLDYSFALPVHRIAVNVPASLGNAGFGTNLPVSMSLGTGYIGGSSSSENLNPEHFVQWSRTAYSSNIFDRFPNFDGLTRNQTRSRNESYSSPQHTGNAHGLARDELRQIVLEELRDLIGAR